MWHYVTETWTWYARFPAASAADGSSLFPVSSTASPLMGLRSVVTSEKYWLVLGIILRFTCVSISKICYAQIHSYNIRPLRGIQGGPKMAQFTLNPLTLSNIITDFQNAFTVRIRRKFVITLSLKIPPHLKCVVTLPCEILKATLKIRWLL